MPETGGFVLPAILEWVLWGFVATTLLLLLVGYIFVAIFDMGLKAGHKHAMDKCYSRRQRRFICMHSW